MKFKKHCYVRQALNFSVNLKGRLVPKGAIYGKYFDEVHGHMICFIVSDISYKNLSSSKLKVIVKYDDKDWSKTVWNETGVDKKGNLHRNGNFSMVHDFVTETFTVVFDEDGKEFMWSEATPDGKIQKHLMLSQIKHEEKGIPQERKVGKYSASQYTTRYQLSKQNYRGFNDDAPHRRAINPTAKNIKTTKEVEVYTVIADGVESRFNSHTDARHFMFAAMKEGCKVSFSRSTVSVPC